MTPKNRREFLISAAGTLGLAFGCKAAETSKVAVVAFSAEWCSACKADERFLKVLERKHKVYVVDIDEHPDLAEKFKIHQVPTYVVTVDQVEVYRTHDIEELL